MGTFLLKIGSLFIAFFLNLFEATPHLFQYKWIQLFMIDLKNEVQARGVTVAHIKTDSIKIPDATTEIIQFVMDFGKR